MNGKGSKQRPTNKSKFDANFDKIFGNKSKDKKPTEDKSKTVKDK